MRELPKDGNDFLSAGEVMSICTLSGSPYNTAGKATSQSPDIVSQSSRGRRGLRDEALSESVLISGCFNTFSHLPPSSSFLYSCSNRAGILPDDGMMGKIQFLQVSFYSLDNNNKIRSL